MMRASTSIQIGLIIIISGIVASLVCFLLGSQYPGMANAMLIFFGGALVVSLLGGFIFLAGLISFLFKKTPHVETSITDKGTATQLVAKEREGKSFKCESCGSIVKDKRWSGLEGAILSKSSGQFYNNQLEFLQAGENGDYGEGFTVFCRNCREKMKPRAWYDDGLSIADSAKLTGLNQADFSAQVEEARKKEEAKRISEMVRLGIKCPTCNSNNIVRISAGKKAAYVMVFGILAPAFKKVRSQFECKQCGYKW
jgi:uncharacterized membrane protein